MNVREVFVPTPFFDNDEPVIVHLAGISYCDGSYRVVRANSPVACFEYVISGTGTVLRNREYYPSKGDTYFCLANENHDYFSSSDAPWTKIWVNVSGPLVDALIDAYSLRNQNVFHCNTEKYFREMHKILTDKSCTSHEISARIALVFHELILCLANSRDVKEDVSPDAVILKNYIDTNIYRQITVEELARLIYRSNAQTIRIFRNAYGVTPYKYYTDNRIKKAVALLRDTSFSVKEIAFMLGFCDEHYFSNLFREKTGGTPGESRKNTKSFF